MVILRSLLHGTKAAEKPNRTQQSPTMSRWAGGDVVLGHAGGVAGGSYYVACYTGRKLLIQNPTEQLTNN